jgi:pimeloyl-ACP methyl ester carboxylesterase
VLWEASVDPEYLQRELNRLFTQAWWTRPRADVHRWSGGGHRRPRLLTVHANLAQRFTVIAPDLLGHGESDKPRADYSLAAFANGVRDLLIALGIDRVTLVGHSLGGGIAMQFAYQYPQFVERRTARCRHRRNDTHRTPSVRNVRGKYD